MKLIKLEKINLLEGINLDYGLIFTELVTKTESHIEASQTEHGDFFMVIKSYPDPPTTFIWALFFIIITFTVYLGKWFNCYLNQILVKTKTLQNFPDF